MLVELNSICMHIYIFTYFFFIAAYCSPPNNPVNGTVHSLTGAKLGSTLRFSCDQGFRLIGQSSATCTRTAQGIYQWNAPVPLCQGEGSQQQVKRKDEKAVLFFHYSRQMCLVN